VSRFVIEQAVRRGNRARVALAAPAGGGKTFTALILAVELAKGGEILVIDTERGSASLYADEFEFKTIRFEPPYDPRELAAVLAQVGPSFAVVVIDSLSHFWMGAGGTLDIVDAGAARARGNTYAGWKDGTPAQTQMVDAMLNSPAHIIATMRSKTEYVLEQKNGKSVPVKVGMAPVQRDGIEYEFTVTADLDIDHRLMVGKTRCRPLSGKTYAAGGAAEMGQVLAAWLDEAPPEPKTAEPPPSAPPARPGRASPPAPADRPANPPKPAHLPKRVNASWVREFLAKAQGIGASREELHDLALLVSDGRTDSLSGLHQDEADTAVSHLDAIAAERAAEAS
jgi:hypothetical protein